MGLIYIPEKYENEGDSIFLVGKILSNYKKVLIVAGKTAYSGVRNNLEKSLSQNNIRYAVETFSGFPTKDKAEKYAEIIKREGYNAVIAIGGGRALDNGKLSAHFASVPVVTIPTVPSTCAAWSLLSVVYNENGGVVDYIFTTKTPIAVIADKNILLSAPIAYLNSGIADTVVKRYEVATYYDESENSFAERLQIKLSDFALDILEKDYFENNGSGVNVKENAINAVIFLAGLIGSISGKVPYGGIAHRFYNQFTHIKKDIKDRPDRIHGEIVGFGLLVQFVCEGKDEGFIKKYISNFKKLGLPVCLKDLNITTDIAEKVKELSQRTFDIAPDPRVQSLDWVGLEVPITAKTIENAIYTIDRYGENI
ncbi:MAG: iron-containing alcohol dehydrogenase family protein [Oscillospiraceae bacterium]|jgi:glycerol dehydrogenase|nr:iron-containing alcohol dehydrogenase family protein [Oscillospiraceae bacterium]